MDNVVAKLSEIEAAAVSIITNTDVQKAQYEQEVKTARQLFDSKLSEMTTNTISGIKADAQSSLEHELESMRTQNAIALKAFQEEYDQHNESYAAQILKRITEV